MPKYRLVEDVTPTVEVFGISCHVPDYRLCWSLNRALGLDLTRRRDDIVEEVKGKALHYPVFEQRDEDEELRWWLVCNLCGKPMVIKTSWRGPFLSCSGYPGCRNAKSRPTTCTPWVPPVARRN